MKIYLSAFRAACVIASLLSFAPNAFAEESAWTPPFNRPVLDSSDPDAQGLLKLGANLKLDHGHIALQAEGHPVWFRNIEIKPLQE